MSELLGVPGALGAFGVALLIFGFLPGMALAGIVRLIPDPDRRRELQAELYEVPRWEQPFWVVQQLEVAIRIGLFPQVSWYWGRHVWHRCKIESGLESHRKWPSSFWVPEVDVKAELQPGDRVKLMWSVRRMPGERMWVTITERDGDRLVGTLDNWAMFAFLNPDEVVKFHIDDIIDYLWGDENEVDDEQVA
jgi:hypothetical protein